MHEKWHSIPVTGILNELKCDKNGLTSKEAEQRINKFGFNSLPRKKPRSNIGLFLSQFNSPLMYILLTTNAISLFLGHYSDAIFIAIVLLINTTVGFYQENKADKSIHALQKMVKVRARVIRDGREKEVDSEELVPGDIIVLKSGDKVPADGRIIEFENLKVNEASLTGESSAVSKSDSYLSDTVTLPERTNMVFMGTIVEDGMAYAIVVSTGGHTQMGKIVSLIKETKETRTPLQKKIASLSRMIGAFVLIVIAIIMAEGYFTGKDAGEIFSASLSLAVSAIPEGLLPAITVILALGMRRILKENGLVRKLISAETLGSVTVICTDKTGTLTEGIMEVSHILTSERELLSEHIKDVSKNGNGDESHILALKIASLVNEAIIENPEAELEEWIIRGRATDKALLFAGMHSGLLKSDLETQYPIIDRLRFTSENKFSVTLNKLNDSTNILYVLGAPEEIIKKSTHLNSEKKGERLDISEAKELLQKFEELTGKGLRVIACAYREMDSGTKYDELTDLTKSLTLVGFIALKDPLREDARESVLIAQKAGIRTIIITGDHKLTAKAIAEEIGLVANDENIIEGKDLDTMSYEELKKRSKHVTIFARVSPHHKLRIVSILKENGEIVAMIGDGINDAPALKAADVGIVVGSGTDVAKEVADLILLDNNFKTVLKAIEQGRVIFQNVRKVFTYLVADDFSELFLFILAMAFGLPLPLLAAQILWINLVEDGLPDIALTTEQETEGVMDEKPRDPKEPILNKPLKWWMFSILLITGITSVLFFFFTYRVTNDINFTRTIVFTLMCVDSLIFAFCVRSFKKSIWRKDIFSNRYLTGGALISFLLLVMALYLPPFQSFLHTQPLSMSGWLIVIGISLFEIILIEYFKKRIFKHK